MVDMPRMFLKDGTGDDDHVEQSRQLRGCIYGVCEGRRRCVSDRAIASYVNSPLDGKTGEGVAEGRDEVGFASPFTREGTQGMAKKYTHPFADLQ